MGPIGAFASQGCEGRPSWRVAQPVATGSASGIEWLAQPRRLLSPASGQEARGPWRHKDTRDVLQSISAQPTSPHLRTDEAPPCPLHRR
eukprot:8726675-Alexandrium_andersonii.AAC.1